MQLALALSLASQPRGGGGDPTPSLTLDLLSGVDPAITFSRNSTCTYFDASGVLQVATNHVWPLHYDPSLLTAVGRPVEEARTNVVLYRRDLANAAWTKSNATAAKDVAGLDGVPNSASSLLATAGNATCLQAITLASSDRFQTAWVKRLTGSGVVEMTMDNGSTWTAITVTAGWTRVSIPTQTLANPTVGFRLVTNGDKIAVDFVQNENGAFATSTIPDTTPGSTVTRAAATATASVSALWNNAEGAAIWEGDWHVADARPFPLYFDKGNTANRIALEVYGFNIAVANVGQGGGSGNQTAGRFRVAGYWSTNDCQSTTEGVPWAGDTAVTLPTDLVTMRLGSTPTGSGNGYARRVDYYNRKVSYLTLRKATLLDFLIVHDGDSRNSSATATYLPPSVAGKYGDAYAEAVSGSGINDLIARRASITAIYVAGKKLFYVPWVGVNDLHVWPGANDAAAVTDYWTNYYLPHIEAYKAAGFYVIPCTEISSTRNNHNARRAILNPLIAAWGGANWGYVDLAANTTLGLDASSSNGTYFSDGTHLTTAGGNVLAPDYKSKLDAIVAPLL